MSRYAGPGGMGRDDLPEDSVYDEAVGPPDPHRGTLHREWDEDPRLEAVEMRVALVQSVEARNRRVAYARVNRSSWAHKTRTPPAARPIIPHEEMAEREELARIRRELAEVRNELAATQRERAAYEAQCRFAAERRATVAQWQADGELLTAWDAP